MPDITRSQQPKLLAEVRKVLRLHYYSIYTERSSVEWSLWFFSLTFLGLGEKIPLAH